MPIPKPDIRSHEIMIRHLQRKAIRISHLSTMLRRSHRTIQRWLRQLEHQGVFFDRNLILIRLKDEENKTCYQLVGKDQL